MNLDPGDFVVSTEPKLLDVNFVCTVLQQTYWAKSRSRAVIEASIENSLCFGLYEKGSGRQIGFARVVTDGATFSWLCDVVIDESERKRGLGRLLMSRVVEHPVVRRTVCLLGTSDAHGFHEKFGFRRSEQMKRFPDPEGAVAAAGGPLPVIGDELP